MINGLAPLAEQTRSPRIAALACVDIGNIHAAATQDADDEHFKQASRHYDRVIVDFDKQKLAVAAAHLGLARLAESAGKFDDARKHYNAIKNIPGQPLSDIAEAGSTRLDDLLTNVHLATTQPVYPPSTAPADSPDLSGAARRAKLEPTTAPAAPLEPTTAPATQPG